MLPELSTVSPGMRAQHHCLKHSTGFQFKPGSNTKLLACVFSVSVITLCQYIFLTFIHTTRLGLCALLTPLCLQFLASVSRPLAENLSLSLAPLSGTPYLYLSGKLSIFQLSQKNTPKNLKSHLFGKHLCWCLQVCAFVYVIQLVCVCVGGGGGGGGRGPEKMAPEKMAPEKMAPAKMALGGNGSRN